MAKRTPFCKKHHYGTLLDRSWGRSFIYSNSGFIGIPGRPGVYKEKIEHIKTHKDEFGKWSFTQEYYFMWHTFNTKKEICMFCGKEIIKEIIPICGECLKSNVEHNG